MPMLQFNNLVMLGDYAGVVLLADEVLAALPGLHPDMRIVQP